MIRSYLTATAMLPIGLIGNGLAPGNIPLLSTRAPFCITPEGTKNKTKDRTFFLLKEKLEKYRSKMWNLSFSMYWKTIKRLVQYTPYLGHLSLESSECHSISNAIFMANNDNMACQSHCLT